MIKCKGKDLTRNCPFKENCLRYTSPRKGLVQEWLFDIPYKKSTNNCASLLN